MNKPLLHFLLFGALLFAGKHWLPVSAAPAGAFIIQVTDADVRRLREAWTRETGRAPSPPELQASVQRFVDEELLLREALRLGLDAADPVARERMLGNMRFAFPESGEPDSALLDAARELGMPARDLVVRRRLVQVMELRFAAAASFDEAALREHVAQHPDRYARPPRYAFRHVFFAGEASAEQRARQQLAKLRNKTIAQPTGDAFLLGEQFGLQPLGRIERNFGAAFAQAIARARPGRWMGPVASPYGLHLIRLEQLEPTEAEPAITGDLSRARAAYALLAEREQQALDEALQRLRQTYRVQLPQESPV